jgi:hypothetical protein
VVESTTVTVVPDALTARLFVAPLPSVTETIGPFAETVAAEAEAIGPPAASSAGARKSAAARRRPLSVEGSDIPTGSESERTQARRTGTGDASRLYTRRFRAISAFLPSS